MNMMNFRQIYFYYFLVEVGKSGVKLLLISPLDLKQL